MSLSDEDAHALRRQVEFYFSDINVTRDTFLKNKMAENAEGFVPIPVLATFNRVAKISKDPAQIAEALRDSSQLVLDSTATSVRRAQPMPESVNVDKESIYVKPIPPTATLEEITKFFSQFGKVQAVWRRYQANKDRNSPDAIKPSVFVVMGSEEEAQKLKASPPKYNGVTLLIDMKLDYLQQKGINQKKQKKPAGAPGSVPVIVPSVDPSRTTPPMPHNSAIKISLPEGKSFEGHVSVKSLFSKDSASDIRYVLLPSPSTAVVVFRDTASRDSNLSHASAAQLGGSGVVAVVPSAEEDAVFVTAIEDEIKGRSMAARERSAASRGSGRGRGGRGRGRGRGRH